MSGAVRPSAAAEALKAVKRLPLASRDSDTLGRTLTEIIGTPPPPFIDVKAEDARGLLSFVRSSHGAAPTTDPRLRESDEAPPRTHGPRLTLADV